MLEFDFVPGNYLVAVTYGPDSMALLGMLEEAGVSPIVCYINYHASEENDLAEQKLARYCQEKSLRFEACDTRFTPQNGRSEDFQKWSRKARYDFFEKMYKKYDALALFLAHQQDDVLESYLLTKKAGIHKANYGRERLSTYHGMFVVRPLLNYTHEDLQNYCIEKNIPYSEGISNFEENHLRSAIRRDVVSKLNEVERDQLLDEMNKKDSEEIRFKKHLKEVAKSREDLDIRALIALTKGDFADTVLAFALRHAKKRVPVTEKLLDDLRAMCLNGKENDALRIKDDIYFVKEYDRIAIDNDGLNLPFSYTLEKPGVLSTPTFDLDFSMGAEDRNIHSEDYPLTIRTVLPQDVYTLGGYLVPVKRMLIAAGIPEDYLDVWPVFLNKAGKVVYVPRYNKTFKEYHTSILKIHPQKR